MTLAAGRPCLAIPGPSVMPDRVLRAMHRPAPNIYAGELPDMMPALVADLRAVARTSQHVAIYIANGHGAWEAANSNLLSPGDHALALVTGRFGEGWCAAARAIGVEVETIDFGRRSPADPDRLEAALRADTRGRIRAILVTHVDTATSVRSDIAALRRAIDATGHPALLAVDAIASLGCEPIEMDAWGIDVLVSASQKGLMTPPGLGFLWISEKARCSRSATPSPYWDWTPRIAAAEFWQYFCGTAPTHHLYGLREALTMLLHEEGLEAAWARHEILARSVWAALDAWGAAPGAGIAANVPDPRHRAHCVTSVRITPPDGTRLRALLESEYGITLGIGLGMADPALPDWHGFFRIGHMGHVNAHMLLGTLAGMDAGLKALGIRHGTGALDAAAGCIAGK